MVSGKHQPLTLGGEASTALVTPSRYDGAPSASAHASPETVLTSATAVVRLKCPLTLCHGNLSLRRSCAGGDTPAAIYQLSLKNLC